MPLRLRQEVQEMSRGVRRDEIGVPHPCRGFCDRVGFLTFWGVHGRSNQIKVKVKIPTLSLQKTE